MKIVLLLYVPVSYFSVISGCFPGWNQYKLKCDVFGFVLYSSVQFSVKKVVFVIFEIHFFKNMAVFDFLGQFKNYFHDNLRCLQF